MKYVDLQKKSCSKKHFSELGEKSRSAQKNYGNFTQWGWMKVQGSFSKTMFFHRNYMKCQDCHREVMFPNIHPHWGRGWCGNPVPEKNNFVGNCMKSIDLYKSCVSQPLLHGVEWGMEVNFQKHDIGMEAWQI